MKRWLLAINGNKVEITNFVEAKKCFIKKVKEYINSDVMAFYMPFSVASFFSYLRECNYKCSNKANIIEQNIRYLLSSICDHPLGSYSDKLTHYQKYIDDIAEKVEINISKFGISIKHIDSEGFISHLNTNAYFLNSDDRFFYFYSRQKVTTTSDPKLLDKELNLDITLERID